MLESCEATTLTKYFAVWGWHIVAIILLCTSLIMFSLPRTLITNVFYIALFILFGLAELLSFKRRKELEHEQ